MRNPSPASFSIVILEAAAPSWEFPASVYIALDDMTAQSRGWRYPIGSRFCPHAAPRLILTATGARPSDGNFYVPNRFNFTFRIGNLGLPDDAPTVGWSQTNQWIYVKMLAGKGIRASHSPTLVSGTLDAGELTEDGEVISLIILAGDKAAIQQRSLF